MSSLSISSPAGARPDSCRRESNCRALADSCRCRASPCSAAPHSSHRCRLPRSRPSSPHGDASTCGGGCGSLGGGGVGDGRDDVDHLLKVRRAQDTTPLMATQKAGSEDRRNDVFETSLELAHCQEGPCEKRAVTRRDRVASAHTHVRRKFGPRLRLDE
jgi:hypothetical protein